MLGPVEYLVVEFPGNKFKGEIVPALNELVGSETIRIIDLLFIKKDADGNLSTFEISTLPANEAEMFMTFLGGDVNELLNDEDILIVAEKLHSNSSAAILVFEHAWAVRLRDAVINAGGRLVDNERIPAVIVEAAMQAAQDVSAG